MSARLRAWRRRAAGWLRGHAAAVAVLLIAATIGGWGLRSVMALGAWTINQTFATATATGWTLGGTAVLTAASGTDTSGNGWLRLTPAAGGIGWAYHSTAFTASQGLQVEFDWATWGGNGADGLALVLYDGGVATPTIGAGGGGLGVLGNCSTAGWTGSYLSLGLDEYGNYSVNWGGCPSSGNASASPNTLAVRGAGTGTTGYPLLTTRSLNVLTTGRSTAVGDTNYRRLRVSLVPAATNYRLTVTALVGGTTVTLLDNYTVPAPAYSTLKVGVAAATGGLTNIHEIRNFAAGPAPTVTGTVFEDVNYGGGAGRNKATALAASGTGRSGARVELFDSSGNYQSTVTTDATGAYAIPAAAYVNHTVRVVSSSVSSARTGYTAAQLPVQTYRTDGSTGTATDVTSKVGGENPNLADAGNGSTTLAALTTASTAPHSTATVVPGGLGIDNIDFGYNFSTITSTRDSGQGSLRQWITNANALGGKAGLLQAGRTAGIESSIFQLVTTDTNYQAATTSWKIPVASVLPTLSASLAAIDGYTQSGAVNGNLWAGTPHTLKVMLDGGAGAYIGLAASGTDVTIRGLAVGNFASHGIHVNGGTRVKVAGNFVGTDVTGTSTAPITNACVYVAAGADATVGGAGTGDGNVLAASCGWGAVLLTNTTGATIRGNFLGSNATGTAKLGAGFGSAINHLSGTATVREIRGNLIVGASTAGINFNADDTIGPVSGSTTWSIAGNYIGTDRTGTVAVANAAGITFDGTANSFNGLIIGGTTAADANVISGNTGNGITWSANNATGLKIVGNLIGRNATNTANLGNGGAGIRVTNAPTLAIGGVAAGEANTIAANTGAGVQMPAANAAVATIRGNVIYGNGGLGIDLGATGVTANDGAKTTGQPNQLIDMPVLNSAWWTGDQVQIVGYVGSAAGQTAFVGALVDVYKSSNDASGYGEGQTWLGTLTADANGLVNGRITLPAGVTLASGDALTATATDAAGNTSEFSANLTITAAAAFQNGSFETQSTGATLPPAGNLSTVAHGYLGIAGWTVLWQNIDWIDRGFSAGTYVSQGQYGLDLNGGAAGGIQQSFVTVPGRTYQVLFDHKNNNGCGSTSNTLAVSAAGTTQTYTSTTAFTDPFTTRTFTFVANSTLSTLTFQSQTGTCGGPILDNVRTQMQTVTLSGVVFEDVNYGGGAGRALASAAGAAGVQGARVELYDASGTLSQTATTGTGGTYSFTVPAPDSYSIRVVGSTVASTRTGSIAGLLPVQTYRTQVVAGVVSDVTNRVGGEVPALADAGNGATTLAALTTATTTAQAVAPVAVVAGSVTGVDFGFNFDTVVNTKDTGAGSLRQVITNANTLTGDVGLLVTGRTAGVEHAVFMIPNGTTGGGGSLGLAAGGLNAAYNLFTTTGYGGAMVATIAPTSALPTVTATLVLDAQTQPGWSAATGTPIVEINGTAAGTVNGLTLNAASTILRGFIVNRFGIEGITSTAGNAITLQGNWSGLNAAGTAAAGNANSGIWMNSTGTGHVIGGTTAAQRNVLSGNVQYEGLGILGGSGHTVQGNYLGTNAAGTAAVGNGRVGLWLYSGVSASTVGGTATGAGNVVAGSVSWGMQIDGTGNTLAGNRIGTSADGNTALPNGTSTITSAGGVLIGGATNTLGGTTAAAGNQIVGWNGTSQYTFGVSINGAGAVVRNNLFGTNAAGNAVLSPAVWGMRVSGGTTTVRDNTMVGNNTLQLWIASSGNTVAGNRFGTDLTGTTALGTGNNLAITVGNDNVIGGTGAGDPNLFVGPGTSNAGLYVNAGANLRNRFTRNSFRGHGTANASGNLGIDLGADGVTVNDGATNAAAASNGIDFPVFSRVESAGNQLQVVGYVGSAPGQTAFANVTVEVYKSSKNASGYGEGQVYLGTVTTDANGNFNGRITLPAGVTLAATDAVTGTAIDAVGNTSEFSANLTVTAAGTLQNGSFESGVAAQGLVHGTTGLTGWTVLASSIDAGAFWTAAQGTRFVELNGNAPGAIQQSIATTPGATYQVTYAVSTNVSGGTCATCTATVAVTGAGAALTTRAISLASSGRTTAAPGWTYQTLTFVADSALSTLTFTGTNAGNMGVTLDDVTLGLQTTIGGTVFEDVNYGGGAGRSLATALAAGGSRVVNATVELYDANGNPQGSTTSDATGAWTFTVIQGVTYKVRVVTSTILSGRAGSVAGLWPVQTYRTAATGGVAVAVTNEVGGASPALGDSAAGALAGTSTWTTCAGESGICAIPAGATGRVRYGQNTTFVIATFSAGTSIGCNNGVFGDPLVGTVKRCDYETAPGAAHSLSTIQVGTSALTGLDFGYNFSTIVNTNDFGQGSLRQWIVNANTLGGEAALAQSGRTAGIESSIFQLPTTDANYQAATASWRFTIVSSLPNLSTSLTALDGTTQSGASLGNLWAGTPHTLKVVVDGGGGSYSAITFNGSDVTVRGLVVSNIAGVGIYQTGGARGKIASNYLGVDVTGTTAANVTGIGAILVSGSADTTVGGAGTGDGNVIAGSGHSVGVAFSTATGLTIRSNFIGTNATGMAAVGTRSYGVNSVSGTSTLREIRANLLSGGTYGIGFDADDIAGPTAPATTWSIAGNYIGTNRTGTAAIANTAGINTATGGTSRIDGLIIGGTTAADANVISGNATGIAWAQAVGTGNKVLGNLIGRNATNTGNLPNSGNGINVTSAATLAIGGVATGEGNTIAASGISGVGLTAGLASVVTVRGNTMFGNSVAGIDLGSNGATANDGAKTAAQPNQMMDTPVLNTAYWSGDQLQVVGYVGSAPAQTAFAGATVDVYKSSKHASGFGEGQVWLGALTADAQGLINGRLTLPTGMTLAAGDALTATATDAAGNTSEFSANRTINSAAAFQNGDFENSPNPTDWVTLFHGDASIVGWTVLQNSVDVWKSAAGVPVNQAPSLPGSKLLDLGGTAAGGVQQSFTTVVGASYTVQFDMAANPCAANPKTLQVTAAGQTQTYTFDYTGRSNTAMGWSVRSFTFTANSPMTTLRFQDITSDQSSCGVALDNVRVGQYAILTGTVFEDVNYGGGPGRALANANGAAGVVGARVELYDGTGTLASTATTAAGGAYTLNAAVGATYTVRVVNGSVLSTRAGSAAGLLPVQTYRTLAPAGVATDALDRVGGETPSLADAGNGATTLAALTTATTTPQSIATVTVTSANLTVPNLDFGFNFDTVVNTNDSGQGSLRQVITNANTLGGDAGLAVAGRTGGIEHVVFMIPNGTTGGGGSLGLAAGGLRASQNSFTTPAGSYNVATITPASALPAFAALVVDAQTQPGWSSVSPAPIVMISGANAGGGASGLRFSGSTVRGLVVSQFAGDGLAPSGTGNQIQGNWIGLSATGTAAGNAASGIWLASAAAANTTVGGNTAAARNVISANGTNVWVGTNGGGAMSGVTIQGNYIGLNPAGTAAVASANGLLIDAVASGIQVGGPGAGQGNVISGHTGWGIRVVGTGATIAGNRIGTSADGNTALANATGIQLDGTGNTVGGATSAHGNQITGRTAGSRGVSISGANNAVRNNVIGLNAAGNAALGSPYYGIVVGANNATIEGNTIGGTSLGIWVSGGTGAAIKGNRLGTDISGTLPIGNTTEGAIGFTGTTTDHTIGGTAAGDGNIIANGGSSPGIFLRAASTTTLPQRVRILRNTMYGNAADRGIDLLQGNSAAGNVTTGPNVNDGLTDATQVNNGIDTPVFSMVAILSNQFQVAGYVGSAPGQTAFANVSVDVYKSSAATATGLGEGRTWIGTLTADGTGNFAGTITPPTGVTVVTGDVITATATDAVGNTSEFSANATVYGTQIVNNNGDGVDANPGDGICATVVGGNVCTLRAAIMESNAATGPQYVRFALPACPGAGCTITPASALPAIVDPVIIDGQTQAGWSAASPAPIVVVNGTLAGLLVDGLTVNAANATIRGLVIGGFTRHGVNLTALASGSVLEGNYIGLAAGGIAALANGSNGVLVQGGTGVRIGGTTAATRNVISGNGAEGVSITGGTGHVVQGSYIGLNASGTAAVANGGQAGLYLQGTTSGVTIGGASTGAGNVIGGNTLNGVRIAAGAHTVQGNLLGTNAAGTAAVANGASGLILNSSAGPSGIGGTTTAARNVISGNGSTGITISSSAATGTLIQGNYIGVGATGTAALPNTSDGVYFVGAASGVQVGGTDAGAGNVISGNGGRGVSITSGSHTIQGNRIGVNAAGTAAVPNTYSAIGMDYAAGPAIIGGAASGARNLITGNAAIFIGVAGASGTVIQGNYIGTDVTGNSGLVSVGSSPAISLNGTATGVQIGGAGAGNLISGNPWHGIQIDAGQHTIQGNYIGTNAAGAALLTNGGDGISAGTTAGPLLIGGTAPGTGNVISGSRNGINLSGAASATIQGNLIGTNAAGTSAIANRSAGVAHSASGGVTLGGTASGARNVISGSWSHGVSVSGAGPLTAQGNYIGTDVSGGAAIANAGAGIYLSGTANGALIGGTATAAGNVISGNQGNGIQTDAGAHVIQGNILGLNAAGTAAVANSKGVLIGSAGVTIGGAGAAARNVISGNVSDGIYFTSNGNTGVVQGNYIGTDATGLVARANGRFGIIVTNGASGTLVGGTAAGSGNLISGNTSTGLVIGAPSTTVQGNIIGRNAVNTASLPNGGNGVSAGAGYPTTTIIGGTATGAANIIAGNTGHGVVISGTSSTAPILRNSIFGNGGLGIDLAATGDPAGGVTANDGVKSATLPNQLMDFPVFTSARARGSQLTVAGYVGTGTGQAVFAGSRIDLYQSDGDTSGYGEGQLWLGTLTVDATGKFSGTVTMPVSAIRAGSTLTGTATDTANNTSEFGPQFSGLATDWLVNDIGDGVDVNPGDGLCETATSGICTLRAAIMESNARVGPDFVAFALPGCTTALQATCTITPNGTALPTITEAVTIDATTQPGFAGSPLVELYGVSAGSGANGLTVNASGTTVTGVSIGSFNGSGIFIGSSGAGATLTGNWVGLRPNGTTGRGNGGAGISVNATGVVIGGATTAARNVIAGSGASGIAVGSNSGTVTIQGNYIGSAASGLAALGNYPHGIRTTPGNVLVIGGPGAGQGNVISGNAFDAVAVDSDAGTVQGNLIGLGADGTTALSNGRHGVYVMSGTWTVGGPNAGEPNAIVGNGGNGVLVGNAASVKIIANVIRGNTSLGIDVGSTGAYNSGVGDGVSVNDGLKPAGTTNLGMDMPVINTVGTDGATLTVDGYVGTSAGQTLFGGARIDFYVADGDASGYGEGRLWLGTLTAAADGRFSGTIALPVGAFAVGNALTATATDAAGNTSEFSGNKTSVSLSALLPGLFNAFDASFTNPLGTVNLTTKTAGVPFSASVVALNAAGTALNTLWSGTVTVEWMDASDNSGTLGANKCNSSWRSLGTAGSVSLAAGTGRATASLTPPNAGRNWRLRLSASAFGATVTACSTDNFAVKPNDLAITQVGDADSATAGLSRLLNNALATGGAVHKAGQPFSLRAQARDAAGALTSGYDGTPRLSVASCVLPAAGCTLGTLTSGSLAASGGVVSSDTLAYSEVGAITVNLVDDTFADVDATDTAQSVRTITGGVVTLGRFVPDHYRITVTTPGQLAAAQNACAAPNKGFTFLQQPFAWATAPRLTLTAENAANGVTKNWAGTLQKIVPASHLTRAPTVTGAGSLTLTPAWGTMTLADGGNGTATVAFASADRFVFNRDPAAPVASLQPAIDFVVGVADASESGVAGNPTVAALSTVRVSNASALPFDNGGYFHYGRLKLQNAFGDARRNVTAQVELQYFDGTNWLRLDDDRGCVTLNANAFGITNANGFLANNACAAPVQAAATTNRGRATVTLGKSPGNLPGSAALVINALATTEGASCVGSPVVAGTPVSMAMPWLATVRDTANQDSNPLARIVWGKIAREWIALRELY